MKTICKEDCGNSPLKEMIRDFNSAFGNGDVDYIVSKMTDDIVWEMPGEKSIHGKSDVTVALEKMKEHKAEELYIEHIITHGKSASCNGTILQCDNGGKFAFCDVYEFDKSGENARIKKMISYVIKTE